MPRPVQVRAQVLFGNHLWKLFSIANPHVCALLPSLLTHIGSTHGAVGCDAETGGYDAVGHHLC